MKIPCKDCPDRYVGCHSKCEKYIAYDQWRKQISENRRKAYERDYDLWRSSRFSKYRKMRK